MDPIGSPQEDSKVIRKPYPCKNVIYVAIAAILLVASIGAVSAIGYFVLRDLYEISTKSLVVLKITLVAINAILTTSSGLIVAGTFVFSCIVNSCYKIDEQSKSLVRSDHEDESDIPGEVMQHENIRNSTDTQMPTVQKSSTEIKVDMSSEITEISNICSYQELLDFLKMSPCDQRLEISTISFRFNEEEINKKSDENASGMITKIIVILNTFKNLEKIEGLFIKKDTVSNVVKTSSDGLDWNSAVEECYYLKGLYLPKLQELSIKTDKNIGISLRLDSLKVLKIEGDTKYIKFSCCRFDLIKKIDYSNCPKISNFSGAVEGVKESTEILRPRCAHIGKNLIS